MRRALHATRSTTRCHPHLSRKRPLHVYSHGEGFLGALGHGDFSPRAEALPVAALASKDVQCVSAGWTHSAAVCRDGEVLVWGRPFDLKQPLRVNRIQRVMPFVVTAINALASSKEVLPSPVSVALGGTAQPESPSIFLDARPTPQQAPTAPTAATTAAATTTTTTPPSPDAPGSRPPSSTASTAPTVTTEAASAASSTAPPLLRAKTVACSAALTVVLDHDGQVYCMGYNRWGQCGQGPKNVFTIFEPLRVGGRALEHERVTSLAVGFQQVLVLCESGKVFGWGKGLRGQLGIGCEMIELPVPVELPGKVVDLRSGFSHAVAVLENGDVYIWGRMQGTKVKTDARVPVYEDQLYPRKVDISGGGRAVEAFCSSFNTLLRMDDGRMMMFGLEADTRKTVHSPVEVDIPASRPGAFFSGFNDTIMKTDRDPQSPSSSSSAPAASSDAPHQFHLITFTSEGASVTPFVLPGLAPDSRIESVSVGWKHTVALVR